MSGTNVDLFEAQVQVEAKRLAKVEIHDLLNNPARREELLLQIVEEQKQSIAALKPKAAKYDRFLNADGYLSAREAAPVVALEYIPPDGKVRIMGRNTFIKVLLYDDVIVRSVAGFQIHSRYRDQLRGKAVVKIATKNERNVETVLFSAEGLDWLVQRYGTDIRIWRSDSEGEVWCE